MSPGATTTPLRCSPSTMVLACVVCAAALWPLSSWAGRRLDEPGAMSAVLMVLAGVWSLTTLRASSPLSATGRGVGFVVVAAVYVGAIVAHVSILQAMAVGMAAVLTVVVARGARLGEGFSALALFALALPARGDLDTFIGFPLRLLAADGAALLLSPWLGDVGKETVLVLEGRVADVEVACSGLSTLWVAIAAALVLGVLTQRARPWRFAVTTQVVASTVAVVVLVALTTLRVAVLAAIALWPSSLPEATQRLIGLVVHVPLGVLALVGAVGAAVVLHRVAPSLATTTTAAPHAASCRTLLIGWLAVIVIAGMVRPGASTTARATIDDSARLASKLVAVVPGDVVPLSTAEQALYGRHAEGAVKLRLASPIGGSLLAVQATQATAHHAPERCLASAGHRVETAFDVVDAHGAFRVVVLDGGRAVSLSFFVSDALPTDTTIAGLVERMALSWRARLRGAPAPVVTFFSIVWPRDSDRAGLDDDERVRAAILRAHLDTALRPDPTAPEHR